MLVRWILHSTTSLMTAPREPYTVNSSPRADITAFVQRQATLVKSKRAPLVVTALRSFLRYLFYRGIVAVDLATCVPTIATWSLSKVPRFLAREQIEKILGSCDKETAIGRGRLNSLPPCSQEAARYQV
jgi:integrase/recombinase XerD